jgi:hypothetical protein
VRHEEETARRLIEGMLGVPVYQHDTNVGRSIPDLRIDYPDGRSAYVEVFGDPARRRWRELDSVVRRRAGEGGELALPGCHYDWWVYLSCTTKMKDLPDGLPGLLEQAEKAGDLFEHRVDSTLRARNLASPIGALAILELGVDRIVAGSACPGEAVARLVLPDVGGPAKVDLARVVDWCGELLRGRQTNDVRTKLAATIAEERHAFIVVGWGSEWPVLHALYPDAGAKLPACAPDLPNEITHLWLLGAPPADRLIAWSPQRGWIDSRQRFRILANPQIG